MTRVHQEHKPERIGAKRHQLVENGLMAVVRQLTYQPVSADAGAVEVLTFDRLRQLNDGRTQRGDFHVLAIIDHGRGRITVDFDTYLLTGHDVVWIAPGAVHRWDDIADLEGTLVLFIPTAPVTHNTRRAAATPNVAPTWSVSDDHWPYVDAARAHVLLEASADVVASSPELPQILLSALIARLAPQQSQAQPSDTVFELFRTSVEAHFRVHHDVGYYAQSLGYAPRTLTRAVQAATGASAKRFLVDRITLEAKRLLVHDRLPASRVAAALGFPDASNFSLFFRTAAGMPPAAWRAAVDA